MAISKYVTKTGEVRYKATPWDDNRPAQSKSFKRKVDAEEWHSRQSILIADSRAGRFKGHSMTINEFFNGVYWPNKRIRKNSAIDYMGIFKNHISPIFGSKLIAECDADSWSIFLSGLATSKSLSNGRVNRIHAVASAIYKMAVQWRYVGINPLTAVAWLQIPIPDYNYWSEDEACRFLTWAISIKAPLYSLYHLAYDTGMRISEILGLQRDCVDLANQIVTIRRSLVSATGELVPTTKSGHKRVLKIMPSLRNAFQTILASHDSPFVFCRDNKPLNVSFVRGRFDRDQAIAGIRKIGLHGLRHTYASHFVMRGGSIYKLKDLMGHQSIDTTMRYAHLGVEDLQAQASLVCFNPTIPADVIQLSNTPNHFPTIEENELPNNLEKDRASF
jgi:integrase